ncbi:MAG TPA: hypothetical protein VM450_17480, partial [Thermomicrobiales bacterium]|nr:hypothetical protein [Thermomicrobiales bacterium]
LGPTLADLRDALGDRQATVARELTKLHEELVADSLTVLAERYADREVRGEIVIVVGEAEEAAGEASDVRALVRRLLADGLKPSRAAREAAAIAGIASDEAYAIVREVAAG